MRSSVEFALRGFSKIFHVRVIRNFHTQTDEHFRKAYKKLQCLDVDIRCVVLYTSTVDFRSNNRDVVKAQTFSL